MKLNCTIDGKTYNINCSSDKPLSRILQEFVPSFSVNNQCCGANCGNCLVMMNGNCVLSCLVPAFKINGATILTYEGFSRTRFCHDIERAYSELGIKPCEQCYASKTILIASLVDQVDRTRQNAMIAANRKLYAKPEERFESSVVSREMSINQCRCLETLQIEKVIKLACQYRSKRRGNA